MTRRRIQNRSHRLDGGAGRLSGRIRCHRHFRRRALCSRLFRSGRPGRQPQTRLGGELSRLGRDGRKPCGRTLERPLWTQKRAAADRGAVSCVLLCGGVVHPLCGVRRGTNLRRSRGRGGNSHGPRVHRGDRAGPQPRKPGLPQSVDDRHRHLDLVFLQLFSAVAGRGQLAMDAGRPGRARRTIFRAADLGAREPAMALEQRPRGKRAARAFRGSGHRRRLIANSRSSRPTSSSNRGILASASCSRAGSSGS